MKKLINNFFNSFGYDIVRNGKNIDDKELYIKHYGKESVKRRAFYNVSAGGHYGFGGNFSHPCWTNIDVDLGDKIFPQYNPVTDIAYDPLDLGDLPLDTDSAELFQSRFAIEHIHDTSARKLFQEVRRVLKKDGVFRVVVPNSRLDYEAYKNNDRGFFWWDNVFSGEWVKERMGYSIPLNQASLQQVCLAHFAANASVIHVDGADNRITDEEFDDIFSSNYFVNAMNACTQRCSIEKHRNFRTNHINWWSHEKLNDFLLEAGFSRVIFLIPGQSLSPVIRQNRFFDNLWNEVALYVEAVK